MRGDYPKYQCMVCGRGYVSADDHLNHTRECIAKPEEIIVEETEQVRLETLVTVGTETRKFLVSLPLHEIDATTIRVFLNTLDRALTKAYVDKK